jgi:phosphate-selective porin OprO/OprP
MRILSLSLLLTITVLFFGPKASAQTPDDVLNILVQKGTITQQEADSLRAEDAIRKQAAIAKEKFFPVSAGGKLFQISGYTQVRYQYFDNQKLNPSSAFDIRRARLDFTGSFDPKWSYRLLIDFVGSSAQTGTINGASLTAPTSGSLLSPTLLDAYVVYKAFDNYLKFTAGQFILPFSLENNSADRNLETIDRSQVVSALVARKGDGSNGLVDSIGNQNGRDIGIQASGNLIKFQDRNLVDYYVGVFNGAGIDVTDNNKSKDVSTRIVAHPLSILSVGASYYNGYDKFTDGTTGDRFRWGGELALNYKALAIESEIISGQDGNTLSKHIDHQGGYAQASYYFVPKKLQLVFKYDAYNPNTNLANLTSTYYIPGVNYYFTSFSKIQLDYRFADGKGSVNHGNDLLSVQFQIAF